MAWDDAPLRSVRVPTDFSGVSIADAVIAEVVGQALFASGPCVVVNHVSGAFNDFRASVERGELDDQGYPAAVKLAGLILRFAHEHRPKPVK